MLFSLTPTQNEYPDKVDLVFITAMEDELTPVLKFASDWRQFSIDGFPHYHTEIPFGKIDLSVVACSPWKYGSEATVGALHRLQKLNPRAVVMTGICAGWEEKDVQLGDVIIATRAFFTDEGKLTSDGMLYDTETFSPNVWLIKHLQSVERNLRWVEVTP
jgi:nucleoside phosphorylase